MARSGRRASPARKAGAPSDDDSLLIESAESLGRVLGSLRQHVFGATKHVVRRTRDEDATKSTTRKSRKTVKPPAPRPRAARKAAKKR